MAEETTTTTPAAARPLEGQVALVTGGARGIGKAIALKLAGAGRQDRHRGHGRQRRGDRQGDRGGNRGRHHVLQGRHLQGGRGQGSGRRRGAGFGPGGHPHQQRGHHPGQHPAAHGREPVGLGDGGEPQRHLPHHQGVPARHDQAAPGLHREHLQRGGAARQRRPGQLLGRQGGAHRLHQVAGAGSGVAQRAGERGGAWVHRDGDDRGASRGRAQGPHRFRSRWAASGRRRRWRTPWLSWRATQHLSSPGPSSRSTVGLASRSGRRTYL